VRSTEKIKKLIRNLNLDVYTNSEADQSVLSELLQAQEKSHETGPVFASLKIRRKTMFDRKRPWKIAALVAAVIGAGAISVVAVNIGRYYYRGTTDDGTHVFHSEDWENVVTLDEVADVEQTRQDLEEIEVLRQEDKRELLKVEITMTDDILEKRVHVYKYELADGRIIDMREGMPGGAYAFAGKPRGEEYRQLRKAGPGEDLGPYEETVEGRVFSFTRERHCLSDGTEVVYSAGYPKNDQ
jgi:hypothetical protein